MPGDNYRYDLRSTAVDRKRDRDTKHKWGGKALNGQREGRSPTPGSVKDRPFVERNAPNYSWKRGNDPSHYTSHSRRKLKTNAHLIDDTTSNLRYADWIERDPSSDTSLPDTDPQVDEVMYSYDAAKGPASGQEVFGSALSKAVLKFEDGQTSKLVNDEYDILDDASDDGHDDKPGETVEEDYEML